MLILAIDTSGKQGSVVLARAEANKFELIASTAVEGGTFSAQLVPQIAKMLASQDLKKEQIDLFAAASGPGSFTGLRVGLAAIKALAEVLKKPIVTVSLLQAVAASALGERGAWQLDAKANVLALLDAGRSELYAGEYRFGDPLPECLSEKLLKLEEVTVIIEQRGQKLAVLTPDAAIVGKLKSLLRDPYLLWSEAVPKPTAVTIAALGIHKLQRGETVSVEALDANYIRRSDAEIFSLPKLAGGR
jgi:tRNA threonylcarbamoyladenosine biosynthesis protein TsaB